MRLGILSFAILITLTSVAPANAADPSAVRGLMPMPGSLSPLTVQAIDLGPAPDTMLAHVNVGLDLRNKADLAAFISDVSDPSSPNFQHFLTQDQFNSLYAPTLEQEGRAASWLQKAGFSVETVPNHLLLIASGDNAAVERAFGVKLHMVLYDGEVHFAALDAPSFPTDIAKFSTGVSGLDDLAHMEPRHTGAQPVVQPKAAVGASCCAFGPNDLKVLYQNSAAYTGTGQTEVIAGAYAWKDTDNTAYNNQWGLPALPAGSAQVCSGSGVGCAFDASNSIEVTLDVQMVHAVAPGAIIKNYMAQTAAFTDFQSMYNKVVTDNPGHSISSSWGACEQVMSSAQRTADDNIFANGAAVGQSWFAASGDSGSADCSGSTGVDFPASSPNMMGVGGTHANCNPAMTSGAPNCQAYGSESSWTSGGGGNSIYYAKPSWQTGCNVPTGNRHVPDVSLESDTAPGNYVYYNGAWATVGGTSDAAPMMGGIFSLLNQKLGGSGQGLPGTRLYQLCGGTSFHDVTTGSNGAFSAGVGYDMNTGVGTPMIDNLLNNWGGGCSGTAPAAPTGLTATGGTGQVALSWTDGSNGGCAITAHAIYRSTTSGGETLLTNSGSGTTYTDSAVTGGTTYYYKVAATNSIGTGAQSNEASATPTAPSCPGPVNNCFASASTVAAAGGTSTGSNVGATMETGEPAPCGSIAATDWWTWTPTSGGSTTIDTLSSTYDTVLAVYTGSAVNALTNVACNDDFSGTTSSVTFTATAGVTYRIQVGGYQGATGSITMKVTAPSGCSGPVGNCFSTAVGITSVPYSNSKSTSGATLETSEPRPCGTIGATVWYTYTPSTSGSKTADTLTSNFDTVIAVYTGSSLTSLTNVGCNDDISTSDTHSRVTWTATAGVTYRIQVGGYNSATGSLVFHES